MRPSNKCRTVVLSFWGGIKGYQVWVEGGNVWSAEEKTNKIFLDEKYGVWRKIKRTNFLPKTGWRLVACHNDSMSSFE